MKKRTTFEALGEQLSERPVAIERKLRVGEQGNKTNITYFVSLEMHRMLKRMTLEENTTLQQLLDEACTLLFAERGLGSFKPIVTKKGNKDLVK